MQTKIKTIVKESVSVKERAIEENLDAIISASKMIRECFQKGGKVFFLGNGGSAADSQHIAAEFIGRFQKERRALPAIALTTDTSILTAISNDYGYEKVFARQLEGLAGKSDVVFGISTSGNSKNVIEAFRYAKSKGLRTIALTGCGGGELSRLADLSISVSSKITARVQETHLCIEHIICELVEEHFG